MATDPTAELEHLRSEIRRHDRLYYVDAAPVISDTEYDRLLSRLKELEAAHPHLITHDSPTQRIGDQPVSELPQVVHARPMLSIDNTYSVEELRAYGQRIEKMLAGQTIEWVVELKIDGVAVAVTYVDGRLVLGATRGNGRIGDDVTHNVRTLLDVPLRLSGPNIPPLLEVRGEVYMRNSDLVLLNEAQAAKGLEPYANTRNVAAGSIRLLDPAICAERRLRLFCHGIGQEQGLNVSNHAQFLARLRELGLPPTPMVEAFPNFERAIAHCEELITHLHDLDFEVDGLVLKVNDFAQREQLGYTSKSPRWLIAYKFEKFEAKTKLREIRVQVGKTGAITPVAELDEVLLAGTKVKRASLHNAEEIERKDIRPGDSVIVEKAGKVIPHIVRVEKHERPADLPPFAFPTACPACNTLLVKDEGGVYIRCPNYDCPAQLRERLFYFSGRNAMNIDGLGEKLIDQLINTGLVKGYGDLYRLNLETIMAYQEQKKLQRIGLKTATNLLGEIDRSRAAGLARVLNAISIRHVGGRVSTVLAEHFGAIDALEAADLETLAEVEDVGPVIAKSVYDFLHSSAGKRVIDDLREVGVDLTSPKKARPEAGPLTGKTLVVTGTLAKHTRDEIHAMIEAMGGKAGGSVSKNTSYLIAGEKAGSKLAKAESLGVPVVSEDEFLAWVERGGPPT